MKLDDDSMGRMLASMDPDDLPPELRQQMFRAIRLFTESAREKGRAEGTLTGVATLCLIQGIAHIPFVYFEVTFSFYGVGGFLLAFIWGTWLYAKVRKMHSTALYGDEAADS